MDGVMCEAWNVVEMRWWERKHEKMACRLLWNSVSTARHVLGHEGMHKRIEQS